MNNNKKNYAVHAYMVLLAAALICLSKDVSFYNQSDFSRAVGFFLEDPIDADDSWAPHGFVWPYRETVQWADFNFNSASLYFYAIACVQKIYKNFYDLYLLSLISKGIVFLGLACIARKVAVHFNSRSAVYLIFTFLALSSCMAHNSGMLNSFYQEHVFYVFFPMLLAGLLDFSGKKSNICLLLTALLMCGLAKTQFFYLPILVLAVLGIFASKLLARKTILLLLAVQGICLLTLAGNDYAKLNYYHSTFLGSYLVLEEPQLKSLGVADVAFSCIGVDAWDNKVVDGIVNRPPGADRKCFGENEASLLDAILPYLKYPQAFFDLLLYSFPAHFTVQYFHVFENLRYIVPSDGESFHAGKVLLHMTVLRDEASKIWISLLVTGSLFFLVKNYRRPDPFHLPAAFILLFIFSQIAVSLVGEGIRDLSKHLAAAQFSLDLLAILFFCRVGLAVRRTALAVTFPAGGDVRPWFPAPAARKSTALPVFAAQFLRFGMVGAVGTAVHYAILVAGVQALGLPAVIASAIGFVGGAANNYLLNYFFTFVSRKNHLTTGSRFAAIALSGWCLNLGLMTLFVQIAGLHYLLSQVLTTLLCLFWNFAGSRLWAFREA